MIHPGQLALEAILLCCALFLTSKIGFSPRRHRFALGFTALTVVLNGLEDYLGAWTMYVSYAESAGLSRIEMHGLILGDVAKWGVMAYVLSRFAIAVADSSGGGGFAVLQDDRRMIRILTIASITAVITTGAIYVVSYLEYRLGYLPALPWSLRGDHALPISIRFWGGLRNLTGEEIVTRLGAQSILMYVFRGRRHGAILSIVVAAAYFELWHNGFHRIYFLNFIASCFFGAAYQKARYECAAVAHCLADWFGFLVLPFILSSWLG